MFQRIFILGAAVLAHKYGYRGLLLFAFLALFLALPARAGTLQSGAGSYVYEDKATGKPITVWYYKPEGASPQMPVVMVMHGVRRNASTYRDAWIDLAKSYGFYVLAPEFSREQFPGVRSYHLGNVFASPERVAGRKDSLQNGIPVSKELWTYAIPQRIFDEFRAKRENTQQTRYFLYGHSAGAHFVLRSMLFEPQASVALAIAANAGWYTMPDWQEAWPYGLKNAPVSEADVAQYFARSIVLLMGDKDNDPQGAYVVHNPHVDAWGSHRFARAQAFFVAVQREAAALHCPLAWKFQVVEGVGHNHSRMSKVAAKIFDAHRDLLEGSAPK